MWVSLLSLFCPHMTAWETPPVVVIPGGAHFRWSNLSYYMVSHGPYPYILRFGDCLSPSSEMKVSDQKTQAP